MVGTEYTQYLRSRDYEVAEPLHLPRQSAVEIAAELFDKIGLVELAVEYGLTEDDDGPGTTASQAFRQGDRGYPPLLRSLVGCPCQSWTAAS